MNSKYNEEYFNYLTQKIGLLSDYDLHEIGISYEEYHNPNEEVIDKLENYLAKK